MKDQVEKLSRIPNVRAIYRGKEIHLKRNYPSEIGMLNDTCTHVTFRIMFTNKVMGISKISKTE